MKDGQLPFIPERETRSFNPHAGLEGGRLGSVQKFVTWAALGVVAYFLPSCVSGGSDDIPGDFGVCTGVNRTDETPNVVTSVAPIQADSVWMGRESLDKK